MVSDAAGAWGLIVQEGVVAAAVVASALFVLRERAPATVRRWRVALAIRMVGERRPPWLQWLGRRVAPEPTAAGACASCERGCAPRG